MWNKSLSQRWRRIRRRCSSFTSGNVDMDSSDSQLQNQYLLETKDTSIESPRVLCTSPIDSSFTSKKSNTTTSAIRKEFNKLQNGFRKRRALSVHESISGHNKNHATFYLPMPSLNNQSTTTVENSESASFPPKVTMMNRLTCSRLNYRKSPSECSSGRGTATPTEDFENDSSASNHSSKSNGRLRKYSCEEPGEKGLYWDQGLSLIHI